MYPILNGSSCFVFFLLEKDIQTSNICGRSVSDFQKPLTTSLRKTKLLKIHTCVFAAAANSGF